MSTSAYRSCLALAIFFLPAALALTNHIYGCIAISVLLAALCWLEARE